MRVADYILKYLAEQTAARHVFMLPGGGCMHLLDALGRNKHFTYVCNLHEQAAAIAAEAYAQYTNDLGVVLVTTGPGATNAITGVAGAWIDSTPLLVLSGQAKTTDLMGTSGVRQMGIQEVDITSMVSPITKYVSRVVDPNRIKFELQKALHVARSGRRGPVWLDLPLDMQGAPVDEDAMPSFEPPHEPEDGGRLSLQLKELLRHLAGAKAPAILVGNGVRLDGVVPQFLALAERLRIPVMTTWKAADFLPEDHPLYVGRPGIVGQRGANFVQQTCDCLLILGTRLDLCQTGFNHPHFAPRARKIMVDVDSAEMDKLQTPLALKIQASMGSAIRMLLEMTESHSLPDGSKWLAICKGWQRTYPVVLPEYKRNEAVPVNTYYLIDVLSDLLPTDAIIVPGSSGACAELTLQAFKVKRGQRMQNTPGLGSMGFGLPASIGVCLASGRRRVVGIIGDGGLQHNIQELETLRRLNLPIALFILNNGGYMSVYNMQMNRFEGNLVACNAESGLTIPDTCKVAAAYGLKTCRIEDQRNLREKVSEVLGMAGPVICEVMVDASVQTAPRLSSRILPDGRMESAPMEDLAPFLDRDEFNAAMSAAERLV